MRQRVSKIIQSFYTLAEAMKEKDSWMDQTNDDEKPVLEDFEVKNVRFFQCP